MRIARVAAAMVALAAGTIVILFTTGGWTRIAYRDQAVLESYSSGSTKHTCPRSVRVKCFEGLPGPPIVMDNPVCYRCLIGDHGRCSGEVSFEAANLTCVCGERAHGGAAE